MRCALKLLMLWAFTATAAVAFAAPPGHREVSIVTIVDLVFRGGFEDGERLPCDARPDSDGDGLIDAVCVAVFVPPDPISVAPPPDPTVVPGFEDLYGFLYGGGAPIQRGVGDGAIDVRRMAVLRGRVLDESGNPLDGVLVRIAAAPSLGYTFSRGDGNYDLVVNGGGTVVVDFQKAGYVRAQRQTADVPWRDIAHVSDVALVPLDTQVTQVVLGSDKPAQVARGTVVTDADGTRRATLMTAGGLDANLVMPNGTTLPMTSMNLRATEFTVGPMGKQRMPALLTPTSAYTYAVELSSDEAIAANATSIQLSKPAAFYVDNFLGFPVGGAVPVGSYDLRRQAWVPENNGLVVKVLSVTSGRANLDLDGSGMAATQAQYDALSIADPERDLLGQSYSAGKTLWRVPIRHLSAYDLNWPYTPPPDAVDPRPEESKSKPDDKEDKPDCEQGSVVECENQTLGEAIPIAGTPYSLVYRSDGRLGRTAAFQSEVVDTRGILPASVKRIEVTTTIAGVTRKDIYAAAAGLHIPLSWDGKDLYGRSITGAKTMGVELTYVYDSTYVQPAPGSRSFGATSYSGLSLGASSNRAESSISRVIKIHLGDVDRGSAAQVGGWSITGVETFDAVGGAVVHGAGLRSSVSNVFPTMDTVWGQRFVGDVPVEGTPAKLARFNYINDAASLSDGSLLFSEDNTVVWKIGTDGILRIFAGCRDYSHCEDGSTEGPADQIDVGIPVFLATTPNGCGYVSSHVYHPTWIVQTCNGRSKIVWDTPSGDRSSLQGMAGTPWNTLYVVPAGHGEIDEIDPSAGRTQAARRIAGNPALSNYSGDGSRAIDAAIYVKDLAVATDGTIYFTDKAAIRKVRPDGVIEKVAGRPTGCDAAFESNCYGYSGDGGPAVDAKLGDVGSIVLMPDGAIVFQDTSNYVLRRIDSKGIITTIAGIYGMGSGDCRSSPTLAGCLLGSFANGLAIRPVDGLAVRPDGTLYFVDYNYAVYGISPNLPGYAGGQTELGRAGGGVVDRFDRQGRHLASLNATTGVAVRTFQFDTGGRLTGITDAFGNRTAIERDPSGTATALVAQDGERTMLVIDAANTLTSVTSPESQVWNMTYYPGGLLKSFENPRHNTSTFAYQPDGRLSSDINAADGSWTAVRTDLPDGFRVDLTSAEGRNMRREVHTRPDGGRDRISFMPDGATIVSTILPDGTTRTLLSDGSIESIIARPDPRFGMQSPTYDATITTPAGLTRSSVQQRDAILADPNDPLSLVSLDEKTVVNGRQYTRTYQSATKTYTFQSPAGRVKQLTINEHEEPTFISVPGLASIDFVYDLRGRLLQIGLGSGPDRRVASIGYDANGYVDTLVDPANQTVLLDNDAIGRTRTQVLPDARQIALTYDARQAI